VSTTAHLVVQAADLKTLRETLCMAQGYIPDRPRGWAARARSVDRLIAEIDRNRPLGPDGTHGDRHTDTCGCEDKNVVATSDDFDPPLSRRQAEQVQEVINESLRRDRASRGVTIEPGEHGVGHNRSCVCWQQRHACGCYLWDRDCPEFTQASLEKPTVVAEALDAIESRDYYEAKPHKAARDLEHVREILERVAGVS
jgi:hypothetical protein